ncbi:MAG: phosphate signaling complex protein PhoU [bacterium]
MSKHLKAEIDKLKKSVIALGAVVEQSLRNTIRALIDRTPEKAQIVIDTDHQIDTSEVEIEEECLKVLALHQPVAIDLRYIMAILKMTSDLERIGDLAANIAERTVFIATHEKVKLDFDFSRMAEKVERMLKDSLDSMVNMDSELARKVCEADDEVDDMHRRVFKKVQEHIAERPDQVDIYVNFLSVSRNLERIADHATNIAEDVIYMVEGEIVRHRL